ncbi:MAG: VCBS repeat-containing protein [Verrucomicrobiae bacterium]|nr:VCBS repeat-containing protein [Verrucomicrobiae bacterium]NNJ85679.1 VCBS repeat-containing protein [Akkermansiaceae bacterium]
MLSTITVSALTAAIASAAPTFETKLLAIDANEACAIADFNKDGVLDVSAGRNWYAGPDYAPRPLRNIGEFGKDYLENNGEHAVDVNGDGWLDIVSGTFLKKEVYWYENPGKDGLAIGKLWKRHLLAETASHNEIALMHDFDGDGRPEYIANSWQAKNPQLIWKLIKKDKQMTMEKCTVGGCNGHGIGFGDVNNDGREDILFGNGWYERPAGDPFKATWILHEDWQWKHASCPMVVTDLNGDGRNDILYGNGHDYGVFWMEQLEPKDGATQWKRHIIDKSWSQAHAIAWIDLDGDGNNELVTGKRVRGHSGKDPGSNEKPSIYYYTWDKKSQKFSRHLIVEGVGTGLFIRSADLDQNGHPDLAVSGKSGTYLLFQKTN